MNGSRWMRVASGVGALLAIALLAGCAGPMQGDPTTKKNKMPIRLDATQGPVDRVVKRGRSLVARRRRARTHGAFHRLAIPRATARHLR